MRTLQTAIFTVYFCLVMILLGGTIFAVIVEYPNWFADIPASLEATRSFYKAMHPGYFFQIVVPLTLVSGVSFVATGWKLRSARKLILIAIGFLLAAELLTFVYIYPRLEIMFGSGAIAQPVELLRQASSEFNFADRTRTGLGLFASGFSVAALFKLFTRSISSNVKPADLSA
jgi:hypothetical protein